MTHSQLHCPHYCNAIAGLLRNIRRPPDPQLYAMHNTILVMAISCKGQAPRGYAGMARISAPKVLFWSL